MTQEEKDTVSELIMAAGALVHDYGYLVRSADLPLSIKSHIPDYPMKRRRWHLALLEANKLLKP